MHSGAVHQSHGKKKPESILFYNHNKCGVDVLDAMCRQMSTKSGCRRWTLAVFYNILDMAAINVWIIFKKQTNSKISRRKFIYKLSEELTEAAAERLLQLPPASTTPGKLAKHVVCAIKVNCKRNSTSTTCVECKRPACGMCLVSRCSKCDR